MPAAAQIVFVLLLTTCSRTQYSSSPALIFHSSTFQMGQQRKVRFYGSCLSAKGQLEIICSQEPDPVLTRLFRWCVSVCVRERGKSSESAFLSESDTCSDLLSVNWFHHLGSCQMSSRITSVCVVGTRNYTVDWFDLFDWFIYVELYVLYLTALIVVFHNLIWLLNNTEIPNWIIVLIHLFSFTQLENLLVLHPFAYHFNITNFSINQTKIDSMTI